MAQRIVFIVENHTIKEEIVEFKYYSGFSFSQKQKSIQSLHNEIKKKHDECILEISSKSLNELGKKLSAFNLMVNFYGITVSLENVYQASKVFENGGPYIDLLYVSPLEAKKDARIRNSGNLVSFMVRNKKYPIEPKTLFYDWIYCRALSHYPEYIHELKKYTIFTDIEYNYKNSINSQARAVAIFIFMLRKNVLESALKNIDIFSKFVYSIYKLN